MIQSLYNVPMFVVCGTVLFLAAWQYGKLCFVSRWSKVKIYSEDHSAESPDLYPSNPGLPADLHWFVGFDADSFTKIRRWLGRPPCHMSRVLVYLSSGVSVYPAYPWDPWLFLSVHAQDWDNGWPVAPTNSTRLTRYSNGLSRSKGTKVYAPLGLFGETKLSGTVYVISWVWTDADQVNVVIRWTYKIGPGINNIKVPLRSYWITFSLLYPECLPLICAMWCHEIQSSRLGRDNAIKRKFTGSWSVLRRW